MSELIIIHNLVDPETGKTYRELNLERRHGIPIGSLVEFRRDEEYPKPDIEGVRLFVVAHLRDCDGTPLYAMSACRSDTVVERRGFANAKWIHGYTEDDLEVIQ